MADRVSADFLILADSAQVQGEKLYLLGGGWSQVWAQTFPAQHNMAVATGVLVPWMQTNMRHQFRVTVRGENGETLADVAGEFEQGRPPALPPGSPQRVMFAMNLSIRVEAPLEAMTELWLDGTLARSTPFRVVQAGERPQV